jgi:HEAT repeat protein
MRANYAQGFGFQLVGPQAGPVIPDLVQLMENTNSPVIASHAMYALANIANVTAPLIAMLTNDVSRVRSRAAYSLGSLGSGDYPFHDWVVSNAVPFLKQNLQDPDFLVRKEATNALLKIAPEVLTNGTTEVSR